MTLITSTPSPLPDQVVRLVRELEKRRESRVFALMSGEPILPELVERIYLHRQDFRGIDKLDVLLDSIGGDIHSTYQLVQLFRSCCRRMEVIIPDYAKSAATFFCLGADKIYMSRTAELGPLDAQIRDPRRRSRMMSALDAFKTLEYLRQYAMETLDLTVKMVLQRADMEVEEALAEARQFVSIIMTPLYSQVKPLDLGEYSRILAIGEEYGRRVMTRHSYPSAPKDKIDEILQKIIWSYPSHGFVIDFAEAKELGLNVSLLDRDEEDMVQEIRGGVQECVGFVPDSAPLETEIPEDLARVAEEERGP